MLNIKNIGKILMLVTRTQEPCLFEVSLADLQNNGITFRKLNQTIVPLPLLNSLVSKFVPSDHAALCPPCPSINPWLQFLLPPKGLRNCLTLILFNANPIIILGNFNSYIGDLYNISTFQFLSLLSSKCCHLPFLSHSFP